MSVAKIRGEDLGVVRVADLLAATWTAVSERSGGPPYPGAPMVDDNDGQFVWSQILGLFLGSESGNQLTSESGLLLISEGT